MYTSYFGFAESPFENNLDQRFLFLTEDHKEVLAALLYFIKENKAFAILCGDVGAGKTMLLNSFMDRLPASYHPIVISNPSVEFREILDYVARTLGLEATGINVLEIIDEVKKALLAAQTENRFYFLVIDEAHLLSDRSLDDIRLLSNIESPDRKLLQILLVGQYELSYKLQRPQMRQLRQRITINRFLSSMDFDETSRYINHRLKMVGSSFKRCFEDACLPLIYKITDGVPRQINHLCDNALLVCKADDRKRVNKRIIRKTDKALRSDLIFAPKSLTLKRKTGWLQTPVRPLAAAGVCVAFCLAILFFGYRSYFGEIGRHTPARLFQQTARSPERLYDKQKGLDVASRNEAPVVQNARDKQSPEEPPSPAPEARHAVEKNSVTNPSDSFAHLSSTRRTYPEVIEVMSSDLETSHQGKDQEPPTAPETTTYQPITSAEGAEQGHEPVTPAREPEDFGRSEVLSKSIAKSVVPMPNTKPDTRNSGEDKQALLSSEKVVVRKGDTLSAIAYRHYRKDNKAAVASILSANPSITDKNRIYSGQVLVIPEAHSESRDGQKPMAGKVMEFSIQVCTLLQSSRAVAEDYASQLKERGYPVYITEMHANDGSRMYKICVGKYQTEAEAMDAALHFQGKEGSPCLIIKSEADSTAPVDPADPSSVSSESEGSAAFPENGEDTSQPPEGAPQKGLPGDSVEQGA